MAYKSKSFQPEIRKRNLLLPISDPDPVNICRRQLRSHENSSSYLLARFFFSSDYIVQKVPFSLMKSFVILRHIYLIFIYLFIYLFTYLLQKEEIRY